MSSWYKLTFVLLLIVSCSGIKSNEKEIKSLFGRKIEFNNNIISMKNGQRLTVNDDFRKKLKIVTYIGSSKKIGW